MSAALRVLGLTLVSWAGFRAMTLGLMPGADLFTLDNAARSTPVQTAQFPALEPAVPYHPASFVPAPAPQLLAANYAQAPRPSHYPVLQPLYYRQVLPTTHFVPMPQPIYLGAVSRPDDWGLLRMAAAPVSSPPAFAPTPSEPPTFAKARRDRLQLTTWALIRGRQGVTIAPGSLAPGGTLGGSQAGARLTYVLNPQIAASLRTTSPVGGGSGGEAAAGIRYTPFTSIPVSITAERRKAIGQHGGGRDAFALFVEGGVYRQPMWGMELDGYAQAGIVGARDRDWFADGGFTFSRPLFRQFSGGFGVWGGVQPGLYRLDAGPRLSMPVRKNMRIHVDWRQRVAGNALPRSGPAVTLAGDF